MGGAIMGKTPFPFVPPPPPSTLCPPPPVTEHVSLHCKSVCKNMARASGGAKNMHPLSWEGEGHTRKRSNSRIKIV